MRALAEHLGGLGNAWSNVEVWIEGGGARRGSSAGMDRATSVRQHLVGLVGDRNPVITWHEPTNRGTRASAAAAPPESNDRRQQVMILVDGHAAAFTTGRRDVRDGIRRRSGSG
jgi:hypothetical protein